jgi:GT2 family glycosyltransferase
LRSPELVGYVRASADRYDAFLFLDVTVPTTVYGLVDVAERGLLVPLLDDEPASRLPAVAAAVARARMILCTTEAEALLVAELYGPATRARTRIIGLGADVVPRSDLRRENVDRVTRGRPYLLAVGGDHIETAAMEAESSVQIVALAETAERDRPAFFAYARAVIVSGIGLGFVPEVVEAWAYGKPVLAAEDAVGAAALVRETGGGTIVPRDGWAPALRQLPGDDALGAQARAGAAYVADRGGWRRVAARTSEAIDGIGALADGRSRDALLAHVAYLYPLVQRQRRTIEAMRVSRFWRLRDSWFETRRRFGIAPADDPIQVAAAEARAIELAAIGDPYQLFREHHRVRGEDIERMRAMARFLPKAVSIGILVDARGRGSGGVTTALRSLREQVYERWSARVLLDDPAGLSPELAAMLAQDDRITIVPPGGDRFGCADVVGPLDPYDRLEPHAFFELALALQDDADVAYSDEDRIDEREIPGAPWFKPDWSPETLLTRDFVGRLCVVRRELLERAGGLRDVFDTARWYEALLRVTEQTSRIVHVAQVLCHRHATNRVDTRDVALAVEVALRRRGESAELRVVESGVEVRFAVPGDERVCVVIPTRDRADLLGPCIASVFERTAYREFEVLVVDNGSREPATLELLAGWERREPQRFRVLRDAAPFNYSRLNNEAARATAADYLLLLNNDTEVIAPEWMEAMLGQARRPSVGAVGAMLLYADGTVQHAGVVLGILGLAGHAHRFLSGASPGYHGALELDTNYLAVTGACMMLARRKYLEVGGLDDALAVSYNDVDLCLRLRRAGYYNVFVPRAKLFHYESKSRGDDNTPAKVARAMDEVATIRKRWPEWVARDPFYNPNLAVDSEDFELRL